MMNKIGATSVKRLMFLILGLSVVGLFLGSFYAQENSGEELNQTVTYSDASEENFRNYIEQLKETNNPSSTFTLTQPYGDEAVGGSYSLFQINDIASSTWGFLKGTTYNSGDNFEKYFIINFMRIMALALIGLIGLEVFYMLYSKKHD